MKPMGLETDGVGGVSKDCWRKIAITLINSSTGRAQSSAGETSWDCHQPNEPLVLDKGRIRWKVFSDSLSNRQVEGATCATAGTAQIA